MPSRFMPFSTGAISYFSYIKSDSWDGFMDFRPKSPWKAARLHLSKIIKHTCGTHTTWDILNMWAFYPIMLLLR